MKKKLIIIIGIVLVLGVSLFLIFKDNKYKVTLKDGDYKKIVKVEPNSDLILESRSKEGYLFLGWYLNDKKVTSPYVASKSVTLEARWKKLPDLPFRLSEDLYKEGKLFDDIDSVGFNKLIEERKSFLIFVYAPGCTSCAAFRNVLKDFVSKNKISFYVIPTPEEKKTIMYDYVTYAPSIVIFKDGEMVTYLDALSDDDAKYYETSSNFMEWLSKYIEIK